MDEAPIPIKEEEKIIYNVIEEKSFSIISNNKSYLLTISKTNKSILFKLKSESESLIYYQLNYNIESLNNLSKFFSFYESIDDKYRLLIENLKYKDILIEIEKEYAKIQFSLNLPLKTENIEIFLFKKEIDLNILINNLKLRIENYQENQNKINELLKKQNNSEIEIKNIINDIENIIRSLSKIKISKNNNNLNLSITFNPVKLVSPEENKNDKNQYNIDNTKKEFNELKYKFINCKNIFKNIWEELNINFKKEEIENYIKI